MAKERPARDRRRIVVNPEERGAGDYAYSLYNKVHPHHGDDEIIAPLRKQLKGLRGERLKMVIRGVREDENGDGHRFQITRYFNYRKFWDAFGPGSAYADGLHAYRDRHSEDSLSVTSIDFETVDLDDVELAAE